MLRGHLVRSSSYNEVIVDAAFLEAHLPSSIDAIFYVAGSKPDAQSFAQRVHSDMVSTLQMDVDRFPLLAFDPTARLSPFKRAVASPKG